MQDSGNKADQKLIQQIANSNEIAFSRLFDKYWKTLVNAAYKVLKDREAAHDVVQELFVKLWQQRASLQVDNVSAYLHTAVKYRVINFIQKHKIPMLQLDFVDEFKNLNSTEELINYRELNQLLQESVDRLPEQCGKVFRMSRFDYLSNQEIAQKLNLSVRTVENHIAHALRLLKPKLKKLSFFLLLINVF